jgi:ABC-type multidrug transport system fused ATPase/permease subunit
MLNLKRKIVIFKKDLFRLFEPLTYDKRETSMTIFVVAVILFWLDVMPIIAIPKLLNYIQTADTRNIYLTVYMYIGLLSFLFFIRYFIKGPFWYSPRKMYGHLEQIYRPIILKKDNLYFESIGTGKMQSVIDSGMSAWVKTSNESIWHIIRLFIIIGLSFFVFAQIGIFYFLLFIFGLIFIAINYSYARYRKYKIEFAHRDIRNEFNATSVRSIMSRAEILFSDKSNKEAEKLKDLKMQEYEIGKKADFWGFISFIPGEFLGLIFPFIGTLLYIQTRAGVIGPADIVILLGFVYFASRAQEMVWSVFKFIGDVMDGMPDIKKLWNFLDDVPTIKGYDEGKEFVHKGGEIELRNINFSYEAKSAKM